MYIVPIASVPAALDQDRAGKTSITKTENKNNLTTGDRDTLMSNPAGFYECK